MTGRYVSRATLQGWQKIIDDLKKYNEKAKRRIERLQEDNEKLREILKYALPHADIDELVANWPSD